MNRRGFLAAGLATSFGGVLTAHTAFPKHRVALADVRRLQVERTDAIAGRCQYVVDLGGRKVAQPILWAQRGEHFDALIENALPFTAEQVNAGLAGLLVVTDGDDAALDSALGLAHGNRLALALADVRYVGGAILAYAPGAEDCLHGWLGNRALANNGLDANWVVAAGWVRLQILNACNARGLLLAFRDGNSLVPFHLLGTDGGLLAAPRELERVFLYSAERVDVAIDVSGRRALQAVSLEFDPRHHHHAHGTASRHRHPARERYAPLAAATVCETAPGEGRERLPDGAPLALFSLRVEGRPTRTPPLPGRVSALTEASVPPDTPTRRMRLDFDEAPDS